MSKKYFTILLVSHGKQRFRELHITRNFVLSVGAIGALLIGATFWAPSLMLRLQSSSATVEKLAQENEWLKSEKDQFENRLTQVAERLGDFENHADRMASVLGVDDLSPSAPAAGGAAALVQNEPGDRPFLWKQDLDGLDARAERINLSMSELDQAFQNKVERLSSTPNGMPIPGWFSHSYGWRKDPFHGRRQFHRGVDLVADLGTPIRSTADGVITRVERVPDYGKVIDVSHGFGYVTRYAHLSEILVRAGQKIRRGDVIGKVGSTGRSTGPHLHYEVHRDGRRVNPWKYLGQKGR